MAGADPAVQAAGRDTPGNTVGDERAVQGVTGPIRDVSGAPAIDRMSASGQPRSSATNIMNGWNGPQISRLVV